jgi:hypothetical protein
MTYTARVAAIKTAISGAIDALVVDNGNKTPTVSQLERCMTNTINALKIAGEISSVESVADA